MEVLLSPFLVVVANGLDQAVMGQLVPSRSAAILGADEAGTDQLGNDGFGQAAGLAGLAEDLPAQTLVSQELPLAPLADHPLADAGARADLPHLVAVIAGERGP